MEHQQVKVKTLQQIQGNRNVLELLQEPMELKDAPYDVPLLLLSDTMDLSELDSADNPLLSSPYNGSIVYKLSNKLGKILKLTPYSRKTISKFNRVTYIRHFITDTTVIQAQAYIHPSNNYPEAVVVPLTSVLFGNKLLLDSALPIDAKDQFNLLDLLTNEVHYTVEKDRPEKTKYIINLTKEFKVRIVKKVLTPYSRKWVAEGSKTIPLSNVTNLWINTESFTTECNL